MLLLLDDLRHMIHNRQKILIELIVFYFIARPQIVSLLLLTYNQFVIITDVFPLKSMYWSVLNIDRVAFHLRNRLHKHMSSNEIACDTVYILLTVETWWKIKNIVNKNCDIDIHQQSFSFFSMDCIKNAIKRWKENEKKKRLNDRRKNDKLFKLNLKRKTSWVDSKFNRNTDKHIRHFGIAVGFYSCNFSWFYCYCVDLRPGSFYCVFGLSVNYISGNGMDTILSEYKMKRVKWISQQFKRSLYLTVYTIQNEH